MLLLPNMDPPFLAMHPALIPSLHCEADLSYSDDPCFLRDQAKCFPLIAEHGYTPVDIKCVLPHFREKPYQVQTLVNQIAAAVIKYCEPPSLAFRFPRLSGVRGHVLLLLLALAVKALYGLTSNFHRTYFDRLIVGDGEFHRHWFEITDNHPI